MQKGLFKQFKTNYSRRREHLYRHGLFSYMFNGKGYVLIIVLLITTLLISLTSEFLSVSQTNIGYMKKFSNSLRASFLARSAIELGKFILKADKQGMSASMLTGKQTNKNIDSYNDIWAIEFPEIPFEDGTIEIKITDENSKLNLSVLATEIVDKTPYYGILQRFFLNMGLSMDLADTVLDWVDINDASSPYGAETSDYYMTLIPPYKAKNGAMDSLDELLLVKGFTPEIYYGLGGGNAGLEENLVMHNKGDVKLDMEKALELMEGNQENINKEELEKDVKRTIGKEKDRALSNYLRVWGDRKNFMDEVNKININTAPYRLISALTENMTDDLVTEIINRRMTKAFTNVSELSDIIEDETIRKNIISVKSSIFRVQVNASINDTVVKIIAIYNRDNKTFEYWSQE